MKVKITPMEYGEGDQRAPAFSVVAQRLNSDNQMTDKLQAMLRQCGIVKLTITPPAEQLFGYPKIQIVFGAGLDEALKPIAREIGKGAARIMATLGIVEIEFEFSEKDFTGMSAYWYAVATGDGRGAQERSMAGVDATPAPDPVDDVDLDNEPEDLPPAVEEEE